jgi:hypothetical protein
MFKAFSIDQLQFKYTCAKQWPFKPKAAVLAPQYLARNAATEALPFVDQRLFWNMSMDNEDPRCCGTGMCIINADGQCWCGQQWNGTSMCRPGAGAPPQPEPERAKTDAEGDTP